MNKRIACILVLLVSFYKLANSQGFNYSDTVRHKGGEYFHINLSRIYGQYRVDTSATFQGLRVACVDEINKPTNKILHGKCFFYWDLYSMDSLGNERMNDTAKIRMIGYYDDRGKLLKAVYFNPDETVQYIYEKPK
jgi:hypothetical protein